MTTTTHSPGPWIIETRLHVHAIKDANGQDLTYQDTEPQPDAGSVTSRGRSANETLANARLIAAAPELLSAIKALMNRALKDAEHYAPEGNEPIWAFIADASDAIAKAKRGAK
jgi:hypothetical protein